jgi:hypothetical protein
MYKIYTVHTQQGEESWGRRNSQAEQDKQIRTGKTGQAEQDRLNWTGRTRLPGQDCQDGAARKGLKVHIRQNMQDVLKPDINMEMLQGHAELT